MTADDNPLVIRTCRVYLQGSYCGGELIPLSANATEVEDSGWVRKPGDMECVDCGDLVNGTDDSPQGFLDRQRERRWVTNAGGVKDLIDKIFSKHLMAEADVKKAATIIENRDAEIEILKRNLRCYRVGEARVQSELDQALERVVELEANPHCPGCPTCMGGGP